VLNGGYVNKVEVSGLLDFCSDDNEDYRVFGT
jgi:hypothetical protein